MELPCDRPGDDQQLYIPPLLVFFDIKARFPFLLSSRYQETRKVLFVIPKIMLSVNGRVIHANFIWDGSCVA